MATKDKQEQKHDEPKHGDRPSEGKPDSGLVRMVKGDEELDVHPDAVKAHEGAGWRVA